MKIISFLLSTILLFSVSYQQYTPVPYSKYNTATALINYLLTNTGYYSPNSLFFQFAPYITQYEVNEILAKMTQIYNKYGLNGVFLILDQNAGISDINTYTAEVVKALDSKFQYFKKDYVYAVVLQYVPTNYYPNEWKLKFAISTGGDYARQYLPEYACTKIIYRYGPVLKYYTQQNMLSLIADIEYVMDQLANNPIHVPYYNYNTASNLVNYLLANTGYYTQNSLFFQFAPYITQVEVNGILAKMTKIYNKYGLNGVFLILDQGAGISNIDTYTGDLVRALDSKFQYFKRDYIYDVILQYVPETYGTKWKLKLAMGTGGSYVRHYLPDSACEQIIMTYGPVLKIYSEQNILSLIDDIEYVMDQHANDPW